MTITLDIESKSYAVLDKQKSVGSWAYWEDITSAPICVCWGIDNEPLGEWIPEHGGIPDDLRHALKHELVEAHNVAFEYSAFANSLVPKHGWLMPPDHHWRDTMAVAAYYALPMGLDKLANALGFQGKDPEGARLMTKYSKLYLKTAKTEIPPEDLRKFIDYCRRDVEIEQSISDYLGDLPERELPIFLLDFEINRRGIFLDLEGIEAATAVVDQRSEDLEIEFRDLTGLKPTQRDKCMGWFKDNGLELENMQAEYLEEIIEEGELPSGPCRRALEIRLEINKASTKKLDAMARQRGKDGRARFQTRYHGALTGRTTGTGFQPLNLNRGFPDGVEPERLVGDIMYRDARWLDVVYGDAMDAVAKASRHWIRAEPGNKIIAGDFVSIEAVVLACLAGEQWKIDAFANGVKIYEHMADKIYNLPPGTVTKKTHPQERQDGKTGELAFGYQGALGAWVKFDRSGRHSDERIIEICRAWRAEHPAIVSFWRGLEDAAIEAVRHPERQESSYRSIGFEMQDEWLSMILPNDKRIWYFKPQLRVAMPRWHQPAVKDDCAAGTCRCKPRPQLTYMSQKEGQWKRVSTYGGKLAENATQATAREILKPAERRAKAAGYHVILGVYDEIISEVPKDFGSTEEFTAIMMDSPGLWAKDWPISVDTWAGPRYKK